MFDAEMIKYIIYFKYDPLDGVAISLLNTSLPNPWIFSEVG